MDHGQVDHVLIFIICVSDKKSHSISKTNKDTKCRQDREIIKQGLNCEILNLV